MSTPDREFELVAEADEIFEITALGDGMVRFRMYDLEADMPPETAQWIAWELVTKAGLPWPPPLRIVRRSE